MIKNRTNIKIKGLNQERIVNTISKTITIFNFKREGDISEFEIDFRNRKKIKKLLSQEKLEILSINNSGFLENARKALSSFGIILGLILSICVYIIQYFFIWKIQINGIENSVQITEYVEKSLKNRSKTQINTKNIEIDIKNHFKEVSSISVQIIGQTLVVNINKANLPSEMGDKFDEMRSNFDGIITQVKLIQGTINCKIGDIVKSGDILVYPYVIDSQGQKRNVQPKAEIIADVWFTTKQTYYDYFIKTERTDRKIVSSQVYLGNLLIYDQNKQIVFKEYEKETTEEVLTKNLILPLKIKKTTYFETQTFEVYSNFEKNKTQIIEDIRSKTLLFLDKNEIIKSESCAISDMLNSHMISYTITISKNIGG